MHSTLLPEIHVPQDVARLTIEQQEQLCRELRDTILQTVAKTGGHLASNLGVVELTVALHASLDLSEDTVLWDVGHQCYAHKLLTGRYAQFDTLRQQNGISGFPQPKESCYDAFVMGHSSTAASAANGIAKAKAMQNKSGYTVAVIGDGAMTGGLAYEGLENIGRSKDPVIVILNDNRMSISVNVGFVARHLSRLRMKVSYVRFKNGVSWLISHIPLIGNPLVRAIGRGKSFLKRVVYDNSSLYEDMGFYYLGPINGHRLTDLEQAIGTAKQIGKPVLIHVETVKGRGYFPAEESPDRYHGVGSFDPATGVQPAKTDFSAIFGQTLEKIMEEDPNVCAITAAMPSGTGLSHIAERFPGRCFDVGIAEEHAVTFASGLSSGGVLPVFAVYSAFLQRSFDQLLNDTSIMNNHIVLAIDRAGVVPGDGETHQGMYDVALLTAVPHTTIYAPATFDELSICLRQAIYDVPGIAAVRYPKGGEVAMPEGYTADYEPYRFFDADKGKTLSITYGRLSATVLNAADTAVLKLTRIWPLDDELVEKIARYDRVCFFEEGSRSGGVAEKLGALLLERGFAGRYCIRAVTKCPGACTAEEGLAAIGLDAASVRQAVEE